MKYHALYILLFVVLTRFLNAQDTLVVGVVPQFDPQKMRSIWEPILKELSIQSNLTLIYKQSKDIPAFEKELYKGTFDIVYSNPYHLYVAHKKIGYIPILNDSGRKLSGIVVVKRESPIVKLSDLRDKEIAFPAPNALGASLLIRSDLNLLNIPIKPKYVKSHSSVYMNVAIGLTPAGGGVLKTFMAQPATIQNKLHIIYSTNKVAPHPISIHPRIKTLSKAITETFLSINKTKKGKRLINNIPIKILSETKVDEYLKFESYSFEKLTE